MKIKLRYLIITFLVFSCKSFAQINITFTVDVAGFSVGPGGVHIAGEFATDSSTTILTQWDPAAGGSVCNLLFGTTYSVTVGFPESSSGELLQWQFVRNDTWDYYGVDMSEGQFGDPTNFLDYSCGVYDYAGGLNRIITIPECGGEYDCLFNHCGTIVPAQCDTPHFSCTSPNICEKFCINFFDSTNNNATAWQWIFPGGNPSSSTLQDPTNICYQLPGVYDVTLITTSANGIDTFFKPNYIKVNPTPPLPAITQAGYTLTSSVADFFQWQFNTVNIPGATNQSYSVMQSGYYTVVISDSAGCVNSTTVYVLIDGINEASYDYKLSMFPNPVSKTITLEFPHDRESSLQIINPSGQMVLSKKISLSAGTKEVIDVENLPAGIYEISVTSSSQKYFAKFLKQ